MTRAGTTRRARPGGRVACGVLALEVAVDWRDTRGERIAQLPSSAQPVPPGVAVRVVCLPARTRDAGVRPIARFTFVRTTPDVHAP